MTGKVGKAQTLSEGANADWQIVGHRKQAAHDKDEGADQRSDERPIHHLARPVAIGKYSAQYPQKSSRQRECNGECAGHPNVEPIDRDQVVRQPYLESSRPTGVDLVSQTNKQHPPSDCRRQDCPRLRQQCCCFRRQWVRLDHQRTAGCMDRSTPYGLAATMVTLT
jgi:hypothetical protein